MKKAICLLLVSMLMLTACQPEPEKEPAEQKPLSEPPAVETPVVEEPKKNEIPDGVFTSYIDGDFWQTDRWDIFEEHFYGVWRSEGHQSGAIVDSDVVMTYQQTQNCGEYPQAFAETETDWYMSVFNGGSGDLYRIPKDNQNFMYLYYDYPGRELDYDKYNVFYHHPAALQNRVIESFVTEITTGPASVFAARKIYSETDYLMNKNENITTDDGREWQTDYRDGIFYLEEVSEQRISYFRRGYPADVELGAWDDENRINMPWAHINIVVEKVDGQWKQTSANIATLEQEMDIIGYQEKFSREIWGEYEIGGLSEVDYDSPATVEGWEWTLYHLKGPNVDTKEHFRKYLNTVFTEECTETILDRWIGEGKRILEDPDGRLCSPDGVRGGNIYAGELEREIAANDGKTAVIHYICHTTDYAIEHVGREILEEYDIKAVYTDLGWRLAEFYWPY